MKNISVILKKKILIPANQPHLFTDEDSDTATGEEEAKVREMRMKEVRLEVPERQNASDSGSDTEVKYSTTVESPQLSSDSVSFSSVKCNIKPSNDKRKNRSKKECIVM